MDPTIDKPPDRYEQTFSKLAREGEGAFVPFTVIGDPTPELSLEIIRTLACSGADALKLGLPFSDPVADGPVIQAADQRALRAGTQRHHIWSILAAVREEFPRLPIGLLVYANLLEAVGAKNFYHDAKKSGVDSVLIADVPTLEAAPYVELARAAGLEAVLIATPTTTGDALRDVARYSGGYTYVVTRTGVTGTDVEARLDHHQLIKELKALEAPPALLGFGISRSEHVRAAIVAGAAGAISGSAIVKIIAKHLDDPPRLLEQLASFVREMKGGTLAAGSPK